MNLKKLKELEKQFLKKYPDGFGDPSFEPIMKKHQPEKMRALATEMFAPAAFKNTTVLIENLGKFVTRSSMVSLFEKPKFRDFARGLAPADAKRMATGLQKFLHTKDQQQGFEMMLQVLTKGKLAKWSLISCVGSYYNPNAEVFVKPTTAKGVIEMLELEKLTYNAKPSWEFYEEYRRQINAMKKKVAKSLSPSNAAFTGFLMIGLGRM